MKIIILAAALGAALFARAGQENVGTGYHQYNPEAIYGALDVQEVNLYPGMAGASTFQKSVGGLTCNRHLIVVPHAKPQFKCEIDQSAEDFKAIYEALNVEEVALNPGMVGARNTEKSVGGLSCKSSRVIYPNAKPTFECTMVN